MKLRDRVALVTGAARGIGRAIALGFAREGASLVVSDYRHEGLLEELVEQIQSLGSTAIAVKADVRDSRDHERLVSAATQRYGTLTILVNNAGIEIREDFLKATTDAWDQTLDTNLKGPFFLSQRAAGVMKENRMGKIINISSVHDRIPLRHRSIYSISKGGMGMLVKSLALELAEYRINVNGIAPGGILTDINRESLSDPANRAGLIAAIPWGKIGVPEDLVGAAVFLASADSDYMTGTTLYVDGGMLVG